jgi:hypothetical protein
MMVLFFIIFFPFHFIIVNARKEQNVVGDEVFSLFHTSMIGSVTTD